ncbi:MAG TPA: hypothetical protein VGM90_40660 [Kofleriaceae bacterium]|jgi:hypothetical protein
MKLALAAVVALAAVAQTAYASPEDQQSSVNATLGLATPVGEVGVEGTFVLDYFELGVGVGLSNMIGGTSDGDKKGSPQLQVALMPRARVPIGKRTLLTFGVGLSGGEYVVASSPFSSDPYDAKAMALWANTEAGIEVFLPGGYTFGAYGGYGKVIAHGDVTTPNAGRMVLPDDSLPYLGIKLGHVL